MIRNQDTAMWSAITESPSELRKLLLVIGSPSVESEFTPAIGFSTVFVDPGQNASSRDTEFINQLEKTIETQEPSIIYLHIPFEDDEKNTPEYEALIKLLEKLMSKGQTTCR